MSHPKILECEINKIGTMFACLDLKVHRDLKILIYLKSIIRKTISNLLLFLEELF
jgi:hypothetical protein